MAKYRKPKKIGSGNQFRKLQETRLHPHYSKPKSEGSKQKATQQYKRVSNERAKASRRINALQKQLAGAQSPQARIKLQGRITQYQNAIEATRMYSSETGKRVRNRAEIATNLEQLTRINNANSGLVRSQKKANQATQIEINRASVGIESKYTEEQVHYFYRETMKAWQNAPAEQRNEAILNYYGERNLANLFEQITGPEDARQTMWAIETLKNPESSDDDKLTAMNILQDNEDEYVKSPTGKSEYELPTEAPQ